MRHPGSYFNETLTQLRRTFRPKRRVAGVTLDILYFIALDVLVIAFMVHRMQDAGARVPSIPIDLPVATEVDGVVLNSKVLTIAQEQGRLFFDNEPISLAEIDKRFRQMVHEDPDLTLIIAADKRVDHGDLLGIYNRALRANIKHVALAASVKMSDVNRDRDR